MSDECVGIDLGTTYSAVAYLDANGKPETIRNDEGELTTPSVVFFDKDQPIVGREAIRAAEFETARVARNSKRRMGDKFFPKPILGRRLPPELIQALILKRLVHDTELRLGPIANAVITVPAYFNEPRRKATQDAGKLAGLNLVDIINEPTAAAIAFGIRSGFLTDGAASKKKELVLVYDLGGGTFDATIMEIDGTRFDAIATAGDVYLGGIDWDRRLLDHLGDLYLRETNLDLRENPSAMERLTQESENVKKTLSAREVALVGLGIPGGKTQYRITRTEFEELTIDLLERTRMTCHRLLQDAALTWTDLTRLILVGGSTRMPMVQQMLQQESGLPIDRSLSPDEAVAHGAALYAGIAQSSPRVKRQVSVSNINSHDLGVLGKHKASGEPTRQIMIHRNTRIPATSSKRFLTAKDGQKSVVVSILEGGTESGEFATRIGECTVSDLPDALPKGTCVKVTFRYTEDGRLVVNADLPDVECKARTTIDRAIGLAESEVSFWKSQIGNGLDIESLRVPIADLASTNSSNQAQHEKRRTAIEASLQDQAAEPMTSPIDKPSLIPNEENSEMDELLDVIAKCEVDVQNVLTETSSGVATTSLANESISDDSISKAANSNQANSNQANSNQASLKQASSKQASSHDPEAEMNSSQTTDQRSKNANSNESRLRIDSQHSTKNTEGQPAVGPTAPRSSDDQRIKRPVKLIRTEDREPQTDTAEADPELQRFLKGLEES